MHVSPQLTVFMNDLVQSLISTTKPDLASWAYHDTFLWMSEAPYDAMIAYVSLHACCPSQITHFKSSFESSNSGVKMPYPGSFPRLFFFSNKLRLSTRWNNISVFILPVALGVAVLLAPLSLSLCCCVSRSILRKSSVTAQQVLYGYRKRCVQFLSTSRYHWARLKNLFGFQSHMKKIFQAANQNKKIICVIFSHWVTPITLIGHEN